MVGDALPAGHEQITSQAAHGQVPQTRPEPNTQPTPATPDQPAASHTEVASSEGKPRDQGANVAPGQSSQTKTQDKEIEDSHSHTATAGSADHRGLC